MPLNVLVLWSIAGYYNKAHKIRSNKKRQRARLASARKTSIDHALCFQRYSKEHQYYYHDVSDPLTGVLKDIQFDAVILDTTVSGLRCSRPTEDFLELKERYSFIADWDSVKIAFPQDEYDHSSLLDDWLADYGFDVVYSVLWDHRAVLYPRMSKQAAVLPALTGYVNDTDIDAFGSSAKPFGERHFDIGYRAQFLPARYGRHARMKGLIAERMLRALNGHDLVADISTDPARAILGDDWLKFLGDCRYCLGAESGSSVLDPRGEIADRSVEFIKDNPDASFEEIEAACFPGEDQRWVFSAISPRIFEAALLRCGQILVEGAYLEEFEPWRHYLPIDEHYETAPEVLAKMKDRLAMERMIADCYDVLIATPRYRYSTHATDVMNKVTDLVAEKRVQGISQKKFESMIRRHHLISDAKRHLDRRPIRWIRQYVSELSGRGPGALPTQ